jgi:hypothetical protein
VAAGDLVYARILRSENNPVNVSLAFLLILLHAGLALACVCLILLERTSLRKEHIVPIILLPIAGPGMALTIELLNLSNKQGKTPLPLVQVSREEDILWTTLKSYHEIGDIVPLEEAILIDDPKTRRKFMLQTLYEDPLKYLDILMLAKNNDDVETSHYATTTIAHTQRKFHLATQNLAAEVKNDPEDMALLERYIETLEKYIVSGLLEEHLLRNMRLEYQEVLDRKLAKARNDRQTLIRKLRNSLALHDYAAALSVSNTLKEEWSHDEQTWIEAVRVCVEGGDHNRLAEILNEIRTSRINWTKHGKEQISAWVGSMLS